ncbi:MAG: site-specific DNA-methyltransferase [Chitinophagaceae bacterium]|nr:site-specific DNA-methyltransferase [Chitinophagaceae bacterium]
MNGESLNILQDRLEKLKADFPEIFTEGKIDIEKFKATFTDDIHVNNERYVLNWAGKSDAFKVLQIPTTATLKPQPEESVNFETTENIFIEGENLEVLKVLQKSYYGKVKCIIIDPPYNTGSDSFIYPDSFKENKEDYQKRIGDKDEDGYLMKEGMFRKNSKDSGHYHSNWLSMMYPRLFLAKNLLRDDGVIFVHIDDNEVHNLRIIMNEIFGEENFVSQMVWHKKTGGGAKTKGFISLHEYIFCFTKSFSENWDIEIPYSDKTRGMYNKKDEHFDKLGPYATWPLDTTSMAERKNLRYPIIHNGVEIWPEKQWLWSKEKTDKAQKENKLVFNYNEKANSYSVRFKGYLKDENGHERKGKPLTIYTGPYTQEGTKDFEDIFIERDIFPFPKPVSLIKQLINIYINGKPLNDEYILDFFGGSGTTAQAVLELNKEDGGNRKFILVQLTEQCDENGEAFKAGYKTIADISKERIRRVIKKIKVENEEENNKKLAELDFGEKEEKLLDLGFKSFKLTNSNFKIWRGGEINEGNLVQQLEVFTNPVKQGSDFSAMLFELLLKLGYPLTAAVQEFEILVDHSDPEKAFSTFIYLVEDGELIVALDKMNEHVISSILGLKPKKVIALDYLFKGNDQLKTNTVLQMKDAGIDFKTI